MNNDWFDRFVIWGGIAIVVVSVVLTIASTLGALWVVYTLVQWIVSH